MNDTIKQGWHRADIMAELKKRGASLAAVGRQNRYSRATMSWALMKPHPRANAAISAFLDIPMSVLWPDWYGSDGELIRAPKSAAGATPAAVDHVPQKSQQTAARESSPHPSRTRRAA